MTGLPVPRHLCGQCNERPGDRRFRPAICTSCAVEAGLLHAGRVVSYGEQVLMSARLERPEDVIGRSR